MASSDSISQDVNCYMCELSTVQTHCKSCDVNLCKICVGEHVSKDPRKEHILVFYTMRYIQPVFPSCDGHEGQDCEMQCEQCSIPVCVKCVTSGPHKCHDVLDIIELCNVKKDTIRENINEMQTSMYSKYEKAISDAELEIYKLSANQAKLTSAINEHGTEWYRLIDMIINRLKTEAEEMYNENLNILQKQLSELKTIQSQIKQSIHSSIDLLQTNHIVKIMEHLCFEFYNPPTRIYRIPTFSPLVIDKNKLLSMFGHLTSLSKMKEPLDSPVFIGSIEADYLGIKAVATCPHISDEIWVCGQQSHKIKRFNIRGKLKESVASPFATIPNDIAVSKEGNLVYTEWKDNSINFLKNGKIQKMIILQEWRPQKISFTASEEILVSMQKDCVTSRKIVRYTDFKESQILQFDGEGNPWFSSGNHTLFIDENKNGDICVSDSTSFAVLVFSWSGKLRFRYTGNLSSNKYVSFKPRGIVTDTVGHILVADSDNNCVHIINEDGSFINYVDNCQLSRPWDLSLDKHDILFVAESNTSKVKMVKYLN